MGCGGKKQDLTPLLNQTVGSRYSAMEHLVPEQMFSTEEAPADGVSAVKAIALAAAEGQRIYTITAGNVEQALSQVNISAATEQEIRNAAYSGKIITTHQYQINFHGWIGEGYIIIDPTTGAGAYKIAGGGNGAFIDDLIVTVGILGFGIFLGLAIISASFFAAFWLAIGFSAWVSGIKKIQYT